MRGNMKRGDSSSSGEGGKRNVGVVGIGVTVRECKKVDAVGDIA